VSLETSAILRKSLPIPSGGAIVFLFPHAFLLLFPFYNPDTINLHALMVPSIGGIVNAMLFPALLFSRFPRECSISNANAQLWTENETNFSRQKSP
jgi:hypothetical protein